MAADIRKVLIVDDNEVARNVMEREVGHVFPHSLVVKTASISSARAELASSLNKSAPYQLMLMDLVLPGGSGEDTQESPDITAIIKELHNQYPDLKIIAVTGKNIDSSSSVFDAGAFAFFQKPSYEGLTEVLRYCNEIHSFEQEIMKTIDAGGDFIEKIVGGIPLGVSIVDRRMKVLYINKKQKDMSGIVDNNYNPREFCFRIFVREGERACADCPVIKVFQSADDEPVNQTQIRGEGQYHRITALPLYKDGKKIAVMKTAYDVTSREEFDTFRRALEGEITQKRRIMQVLNTFSRQYKRAHMLLITDDGSYVGGFKIENENLDNFGGQLVSKEENPQLLEVLYKRKPKVFALDDMEDMKISFWQETNEQGPPNGMEYGFVPMNHGDASIVGAIYVDNFEPILENEDIRRRRPPITQESLKKFVGVANEGAKAIVESKNIEMMRRLLELIRIDDEVLGKSGKSELLKTLLDKCVHLIEETQKSKIIEADVTYISGQIMMVEGLKLRSKAEINISACSPIKAFDLEKDNKSLAVKTFKNKKKLVLNNLSEDPEWKEYLDELKTKSAEKKYIDYLTCLNSYACFPLMVEDRIEGVLFLQSAKVNLFDTTTLGVIQAFVNRTAQTVASLLQMQMIRRIIEMYSAMALTKSVADGNNEERTIFALLSGLTHGEGLSFNRAIFLKREGGFLKERYSIGPRTRDEGERLYEEFEETQNPLPLKDIIMGDIRFNEESYGIPDIEIGGLPKSARSFKPGEWLRGDVFKILDTKEIDYLPISDGDDISAVVFLDNFLTGRVSSKEKMKVLDAVAIDYSTLFKNIRMIHDIEEAQKREEFMHVFSHRLKTDLSGCSELIRRSIESKQPLDQDQLRLIAEKLWPTERVFNDLLALSWIQSQKIMENLSISFIDIEELITNTAQEALPLKTREIRIDEPLRAKGDKQWLRHALTNLLDNAALYSKENTTININGDTLADSGCIRISVISEPRENEMDWKKLLQKFERGKNGAYAKGTGLGLYIVEQIMIAHKGHLNVEPLHDGKVSFSLLLPSYESSGGGL